MQVLVTAMVLLWAARLGSFLVKRIHAVGKDSRFDKMRGVLVTMFLVFSLSVRDAGTAPVQAYLTRFVARACVTSTGCVGVPLLAAGVRHQWLSVSRLALAAALHEL